MLSAGPTAKAIKNSGFEKVYQATTKAIESYIQNKRQGIYKNKFRVIIP